MFNIPLAISTKLSLGLLELIDSDCVGAISHGLLPNINCAKWKDSKKATGSRPPTSRDTLIACGRLEEVERPEP